MVSMYLREICIIKVTLDLNGMINSLPLIVYI